MSAMTAAEALEAIGTYLDSRGSGQTMYEGHPAIPARAALPILAAALEERDALAKRVEQFERQALHRIATHPGTTEADRALAARENYRMKQRLDERAKANATIGGLAKEAVALQARVAALEEAAVLRTGTLARCHLCEIGACHDDPDPALHRDRCPLDGDVRALLAGEGE